MDFDPIIPEDKDGIIIDITLSNSTSLTNTDKETLPVEKEPLSINNLVSTTKTHISDDEKCRLEIEMITKELNRVIDIMSVKELIEYYKAKLKEREFHCDYIFKAFNFAIKTEYAKHLLVGSNKDDGSIRNISSKDKIRALANLLKQHS